MLDCKTRGTHIQGMELDSSDCNGRIGTLGTGVDQGPGEVLQLMQVEVASREQGERPRRRSGVGTACSMPVMYEVELLATKASAKGGRRTTADAGRPDG